VAGEFCGKLLADLGAEVIKVEQPGQGSPTRVMAPLVHASNRDPASALFAYLNTNKHSVTIDLDGKQGSTELLALLETAAAVIDDHDAGWLRRQGLASHQLATDFPDLVFTSVTRFGLMAPPALATSTSLTVMQASGWGYHTASQQDLSKPPLKGPGRFLVDYEGGLDAAICTLAALVSRERTGRGDFVDLSVQSVLVSRADHIVGRMLANEMPVGDARSAFVPPSPSGAYRCSDGYVHLYGTPVHWPALIELLGHPTWAEDFPANWLFDVTPSQLALFQHHFNAWVRDKLVDPLCEKAQALDIPMVRVNDAAQILGSEQLAARGYFQQLDHPELGAANYPTVPYRLSATPVRLTRPAPALGQDNHLLDEFRAAAPRRARESPAVASAPPPRRKGPLAGIRVLAITKVWAGPYAGKLLAFLGAEVIKVESRNTLDSMRTYQTDDVDKSTIFKSLNPEVLSVQVNMKSETGLRNLKEMIARSDIVIDNLRPGALARLGLDYEGMRKIKRDIIFASLKMHGSEGPLAHQTGYAPSFLALSGIHTLVGYEGEPPCGMNQFYGDTTAGAAIVCGALAALAHRERTGEGQYVDVSATEALSSMIGDSLFEFSLTGNVPQHDGNHHADMAPHGVYSCLGGEWVAIAAPTDDTWRKLCAALGVPDLAKNPIFASLESRQKHQEALDEQISRLTSAHHAAPLAALLRQAGVPAHKSANSLDLISDAHLWERQSYTTVLDAIGSVRPIVGAPWRFMQAGARLSHGAPSLGQHNDYVYREILGLSEEQIHDFIKEDAIA
jgi:crotonobetainyl-CoA:carnitine CoA-transferase CaiB-like acyl-CoA transferase